MRCVCSHNFIRIGVTHISIARLRGSANILVVDSEEPGFADIVAKLLRYAGYNPLPLYSLQDALEQTQPLGSFELGKFFFDVAILCTIRPHLEGIRFADRLLELLPCCRIVVIDDRKDVEFLRSIRSDFSYLQTPLRPRTC
jgi:hypothetical protein